MTQLSRVLEFALSQTWAMDEGTHRRMMQILLRHEEGIKLSAEELEAATGDSMPKRRTEMRVESGVAIIPIHGVISHRASSVGRLSSNVGTSVEHISADLGTALDDPDVRSIVLDVDSPGGSVSGVDDLANEIRAAREQKPIVARTDAMMASAAYWLASQADRIIATRSAFVGSVGVIASFLDTHRAMANRGYDPVVVKSTPAKGGVQTNGSVSDGDRADVQREVDVIHRMFLEGIAAGRGIDESQAKVLGDGRAYLGSEALERGYIDEIGTVASALKHAKSLGRKRAAEHKTSTPVAAIGAGAHQTEEEPQMTATKESAVPEKQASQPTAPAAPEPTPQPEATAAVEPDPAPSADDRIAAERQRTASILDAADKDQQVLAQSLIADGTPEVDALKALIKDRREKVAPPTSASLSSGNSTGVDTRTEEERLAGMPEGVSKWDKEWEASADLRGEFLDDKQSFLAFKKAETDGRIKR